MKTFVFVFFGFCLVVVVVLSYQKMNRTRALVEATREQPIVAPAKTQIGRAHV